MTWLVNFQVQGKPITQGNKTMMISASTGKPIMLEGKGKEAQEEFKAWRASIQTMATMAMRKAKLQPLEGPLEVYYRFLLPKPKSKPKWKWLPDVKPDSDKLERAVNDAMTKIVFVDDAQICVTRVEKFYAIPPQVPGVIIGVKLLQERDV